MSVFSRQRETDRLEAFSDGIFAFAITLLVLGLYDPTTRGSGLFVGLLNEWPSFLAFAISFITILIMWMNHHNMFNYVKRVSRELIVAFVNAFTSVVLIILIAVYYGITVTGGE